MAIFELLNTEDTHILGRRLARNLEQKPQLILLNGDLGAGKTTFVQGFIQELLPGKLISSPTYSYLNIYQASCPIFHFDLYRLSSKDNLEDLGLWEHLLDDQALRLVEWSERVEELKDYADIILDFSICDTMRKAKIFYKKSFNSNA